MRDIYKPYLDEWLAHHRSIGVDHFFIYDHDSVEPLSRILKGNPDITVKPIHGIPSKSKDIHKESYLDFLTMIQSGSLPHFDRVAFIDEDEFITCINGNLKTTLLNYLDSPAIGISWRIFGSSGVLTRTPELQSKKFTKYTGKYYHSNINMKSIVNPYLVKENLSPHSFSYYLGNCVNEHHIVIPSHYTYPSYDYIWINHYWTRSREEFIVKANRGMVETGETRDYSMFDNVEMNCTESL
jgi:hypothetical protein